MKTIMITFSIMFTALMATVSTSNAQNVKELNKTLPTTKGEYTFMLEGDLDLGRQQQYSGINQYNDYIGEYIFTSMDIIEDLAYRYVGTVVIITNKKEKQTVICIPYKNEQLMETHKRHLSQLFKHPRLAKAYTEFMARRAAFSSAISHVFSRGK
ncbi:MAG: hypothetical protein ACPGJS_03430 [Flammeovirgaceae bacterium]